MWRTLFRREVFQRSSFLGNLKASDKKLDLRRTPTWIKKKYCLFIFSGIPSLACNNHVLGWNSWPTGALLHRSVKRPFLIKSFLEFEKASNYNTTVDSVFTASLIIKQHGMPAQLTLYQRGIWQSTHHLCIIFKAVWGWAEDSAFHDPGFPLSSSSAAAFDDNTLNSVVSHLWQPKCTWYYGVL